MTTGAPLPAPPAEGNPGGGARILVVEDDANLRLGLEMNLRAAGYVVLGASDGPSGLRLARSAAPDLVILDLRLPHQSGLDILSTLRDEGFSAPVIILSALGEEADKVAGLRRGADDYVVKPFGLSELLARVSAALRRTRGGLSIVRFADVEVDRNARIVRRGGRPVHLTPKEFDLLDLLVRSPGKALSRERLLDAVWGGTYDGTVRTVDNFMASLRRKLDPRPEDPVHLVTVRGTGYRFDP